LPISGPLGQAGLNAFPIRLERWHETASYLARHQRELFVQSRVLIIFREMCLVFPTVKPQS